MNNNFIQVQNEIREDYKVRKSVSPVIRVLRSRPTKGIIFLFVFAIVVPVLIYYFIIDRGSFPKPVDNTCSVGKTYRISCGKTQNVTLNYCSSINCCYDNSTKLCFHYLPSRYYYFAESQEQTEYQRSLELSPFERDLWENIQLSVTDIDENNVEITLHDVKLTVNETRILSKNYNYTVNRNPLFVEVYRNNDTLLTTAKGPTIASDNYWEWSFQLSDEYLFGLGQTLLDVDENSTITKVIYANSKDHNTLPLFMAYKGGKYHGLIVRHSGPLEVTVLPSKLVSLKSLVGGKIVLVLSVGPTIHEVMLQQRRSNANVDLETLGVHICREGSSLDLSYILADYQNEINALNENDRIKFRYESDCLHENLVMALRNEDREVNKEAAISTVNNITANGYRFMLALSPQVSLTSDLYGNTTQFNVYYKGKNESEDYQGEFFKTKVVYPNFGHSSIEQFMQKLTDELKGYFGEALPKDIILTYNWPSDDSFTMEEVEDLQYLSEVLTEAMSSTLPWNVTSETRQHFVDHNDYGALYLEKIKAAIGKNNSFLMTVSHNFDTVEPLILQNIDISWTNFRKAIITTLYNSIFGYPLTSIPVCGSTATFNSSYESLCIRWYLMASTAPIFRISSDSPRRDPNSLASSISKYAGVKANDAIDFRYSLQYYFYTVLNNDEPLMRPMFYDFPDDNETFPLVHQYMVGGSFLVAHPTLPDQSQMLVYLPKSVDTWYEFWGGQAFSHSSMDKNWVTLPIVESDWIAFVPAGVIIPFVQRDADDTSKIELKLTVALQCNANLECVATGNMKTIDALYIFNSTHETLTIERQAGDSPTVNENFVLTEATLYSTSSSNYYKSIEQNLSDINTLWSYNYNSSSTTS